MQATAPAETIAVRFYQREVENEYLTTQEGRPIKYMADFVRIEVPGDMTSIIDTFASDSHKQRFPMQWAQYQNEKQAGAPMDDVQGTLLRDWPLLTSAQATEMRHFKFYTVEQVANSSDQQIATLGMIVGMSPFSFREKARAFLAAAKDSSLVQQQADELKKRDVEISDLKDMVARLGATVEKLQSAKEEKPSDEAGGRPAARSKKGEAK
jgi:hypothetical protein